MAAALLVLLGGCAYYNVYYLAKKNFDQASQGEPYPAERASGAGAQGYDKTINFSKNVIARYPKSKWVDDAYLLWARGLLGKGDPFQAIDLLEQFDSRFPASSLRGDALFFLAVSYRHARKLDLAIAALDTFQARHPKDEYATHAWLERSRVQLQRKRFVEAGSAADVAIRRSGKKQRGLGEQALRVRAQARFERGVYDSARADFRALGSRALTDDERLEFMLREAECLAKAGQYDEEIALLNGQLGHESLTGPGGAGLNLRRARVLLALGSAYGRANAPDKAEAALRSVVADFAKQTVAAEAQYQLGYLYEVHLRDFTRARDEYGKVKDQSPSSPFVVPAQQRVARLDRLEQFGGARGDTLSRQAEKEFGVGENYLLELNQPDRALEQYVKVAREYPRTQQAARSLNAAGWVLSRKLNQAAAADSFFWRVILDYKGTEEALAARDYLEYAGRTVPDTLIEIPAPPPPDSAAIALARADSVRVVRADSLRLAARADSARAAARMDSLRAARPDSLPDPGGAHPDSLRGRQPEMPDSLVRRLAMDRRFPGADTLPGPIGPPPPPDTARLAAPDSTRRDTVRRTGAVP